MSPNEFLAKHEEVIDAVEVRCKADGVDCSVIDKVRASNYRETWFIIDKEIYKVFNSGQTTNHEYLGVYSNGQHY